MSAALRCRRCCFRRLRPSHVGWGAGFTLLELLVVISLIVVLLAIMLPSLQQARAAAQLVVCQMRLGQWGLAFAGYASEHAGFYAHTDGLDRDNGPADQFGWVDVVAPLLGEKPWRDHSPGPWPGPESIFQCASARLASPDAYGGGYHPRENGYFSYAMNSCLELDRNCWRPYGYHAGDSGYPMPSFLKRERIVNPQRVVLLFDQLLDPKYGYDATADYDSTGEHCSGYPKSFSVRHRRSGSRLGGSILYCDGHVAWVSSVWKSNWPADLEVPPRDDPDWYPYPP